MTNEQQPDIPDTGGSRGWPPLPHEVVRVATPAYYLDLLENELNEVGATIAFIEGKLDPDAPDAEFCVAPDADVLRAAVRWKNYHAWTDFAWLAMLGVAFVVNRWAGADLIAGLCGGLGLALAWSLALRFREIGAQRALIQKILTEQGERA